MVKRNNLVEIGRVAQINYGSDAGKLCTIIDIVDQSRALIDGPFETTGIKRQTIPLKNLSLTGIKVQIPRGARVSTLKKALVAADALGQWKKTSWAKKAARDVVRKNLTDFDRFKSAILKKQKNFLVGKEFSKLKKASRK